MPTFDDQVTAAAVPEEIWKLLYDPTRFPEWWVGVETVEPDETDETDQTPDLGDSGDGYTMYPTGYPDYPMPQALRADQAHDFVEISCLVSNLVFAWRLTPEGDGTSTRIAVHVEIPADESHRLETQADVIHRSLANLARLAELTAGG
jgi:uncharacterized protein YndB with AHSA1/START domain